MSMQTTTLRPGLLVSLATRVSGNVQYTKRDLEIDRVGDDGARRAKWETERTINDPAEFETATKIRSKTRSLITAVCAPSSFGLLCPEGKKAELIAAIEEAQRMARDFNATATLTRVDVYVIAGQIAADDVQAVSAINAEMRDLMDAMEGGLKNLDVKVVRDAANRARQLGAMLSPDAAFKAKVAIEAARDAARKVVKAGETAAGAIDQQALESIRQSRMAFLDLDAGTEIEAPVAHSRSLDLSPAVEPAPVAPVACPQIEL